MFDFNEASHKGREVLDGMLKSYAEVNKAFQHIATEASEFSKKSCMDGVAHVEALASVRSPEAAYELNAAYLRSAYENAVSEMTRIGGLYVDLARLAYRPFEAPVSTVVPSRVEDAPAPAAATEPAVSAA